MKKQKRVSRIAPVIAIAMIAIVAIALVAPAARAQDGVNTPMSSPSSVPAMGSGTVGDSIRADHANDASAPAAQPASSDDMSGDSISVTGGVPGSTTSGTGASEPAAPAEASAPAAAAPAEASAPAPAAPAEATVPAPAAPAEASAPAPAAPAEASAPASAPPAEASAPAPAEASAPAAAQPAVSATTPEAPPVTASEPAPAAVPSVAPAPEAAASLSTPVTTAAMPPSGTLAPPMVLAPVPAEVAPEPGPSPANAPVAAEQAAPQRQSDKTAGKSGRGQARDTKVASNEPQENNPTGLQFGNNKGPIHIKSESMSLDYQNHSVLWTGHVHATQDQAQLTSDKLRVNYFDKDFKQLKDMVADGNVRMSQGTQWATGEHGVMDQTKRTMVLTGSPVVHDCANQITGKRITVFLDTNKSVVEDARAVIFPHSGKGDDSAPTPGCQ